MHRFVSVFFLATLFSFSTCLNFSRGAPDFNSATADSIRMAETSHFPEKQNVNFHNYSVFSAEGLHFDITDSRPSKDSSEIVFCIAGAFTNLQNFGIDGLYIRNGEIISKNVNHSLGGGLLVSGDKISIIKTSDGKLLTPNWIDSVSNTKSSFFQQIQLVRNDSAIQFHKDQKLFQRRAIVIFKDGKTGIVESNEAITLQQFADDLVAMNVHDALYTDMGGWDEGWYREKNGKTKTIGLMRSDTNHQSNWVILTK